MKVIILAAEVNKNGQLPKGLENISDDCTNIENQVNILLLHGFCPEQICIAISDDSVWYESKAYYILNKLGVIFVKIKHYPDNRSAETLSQTIKSIKFENDSQFLLFYSDFHLSSSYLDKINLEYYGCTFFVRKPLRSAEKGPRLRIKAPRSLEVSYSDSCVANMWSIFAGAVKFDASIAMRILTKEQNVKELSALELLNKSIGEENISLVCLSELDSGLNSARKQTSALSGGSFAGLYKKTVVRKYAFGEGVSKLKNEIKWLSSIPKDGSNCFPPVLASFQDENQAWYEMPWFNNQSLRYHAITGSYSSDQVLEVVSSVLEYMAKNLYSEKRINQEKNWVEERHIKRVSVRLTELKNNSEIFRPILSKNKIQINGKEFPNLPCIFGAIMSCNNLLKDFEPDEFVMIHGDLHFQNILVPDVFTKDSFTLADPRGELRGGDIFYDIGKLYHSVNGKYDLIHTDQFSLDEQLEFADKCSFSWHFNNKYFEEKYDYLYRSIKKKLEIFLNDNDKLWHIKALFSEAMHFSSVMPFHLYEKKKPERAIVMYLTGVRLMYDLYNELSDFGYKLEIPSARHADVVWDFASDYSINDIYK